MKQFLESNDLLALIEAEANKNRADATQLFSGLSEEQLNWTSHPEKWSIAQCLDHLTKASKQFEKYYIPAIKRGREKYPVDHSIAYRPTFLGGWLAKAVDPSSVRKFPAPKVFRPSQSAVQGALQNFLQQQDTFLSYVREARGLDYNRTRMRSPVTPLMRYSLADAFVVNVLHDRRHLAQAQRMKESQGFPA